MLILSKRVKWLLRFEDDEVAVENGVPIFRQTGRGVSSVIDAYGRVINRVDMYEEDPSLWDGVQMVDVPIGSVSTLYPRIGEVFGWVMVVGWVGLLGFAWIKRERTERKAATRAQVHEP